MTSKELSYVEDALSHEYFMKSCAQTTSDQLTDTTLSNYMQELIKEHNEIFNEFKNLL